MPVDPDAPVPGSPRDPRMDRLDHRPDLYGLVEGVADAPDDLVQTALRVTCPGCVPNVFIEHDDDIEHVTPTWAWPGFKLVIAHDEHCSWLAAQEAEQ